MSIRHRQPTMPADQLVLIQTSLGDEIPAEEPVRLLSAAVDQMDCSALMCEHSGPGAPPYDPRMLLKVFIFGMTEGLRSSRQLAKAVRWDVRYMWLMSKAKPDHNTFARFRRRNAEAICTVYRETVRLAARSGLVSLRVLAVDGTKLEANASGRQIMSRERIERLACTADAQMQQAIQQVDRNDEGERDQDQDDEPGSPTPPKLSLRQKQLFEAKRQLDESGCPSVTVTDPESRVMRTTAGLKPGYNAQSVVDAQNQIIVAADVTNQASDNAQFAPMVEQAIENCEGIPEAVTADAGYWSEPTLRYIRARQLDAYVSHNGQVGRHRLSGQIHSYDPERDIYLLADGTVLRFNCIKRQNGGTLYRRYRSRGPKPKELLIRADNELCQAMDRKLHSPEGRAVYSLRQQIVEPVFGHIKGPFNLRRLLLRGHLGARCEYLLACIAHNIGKICRFAQITAVQAD